MEKVTLRLTTAYGELTLKPTDDRHAISGHAANVAAFFPRVAALWSRETGWVRA